MPTNENTPRRSRRGNSTKPTAPETTATPSEAADQVGEQPASVEAQAPEPEVLPAVVEQPEPEPTPEPEPRFERERAIRDAADLIEPGLLPRNVSPSAALRGALHRIEGDDFTRDELNTAVKKFLDRPIGTIGG